MPETFYSFQRAGNIFKRRHRVHFGRHRFATARLRIADLKSQYAQAKSPGGSRRLGWGASRLRIGNSKSRTGSRRRPMDLLRPSEPLFSLDFDLFRTGIISIYRREKNIIGYQNRMLYETSLMKALLLYRTSILSETESGESFMESIPFLNQWN